MSLEFFVRLRDACDEEIEKKKPAELKAEDKPVWDPLKVKWTQAEGNAGPYERSDDKEDNPDFKNMLKDLESHNGKLSRGDFFYWRFESGTIVGRKKRKF